jgi:hypothetical protein
LVNWNLTKLDSNLIKRNEMQIGVKGIENMLMTMVLRKKNFGKDIFSFLFLWESVDFNLELSYNRHQVYLGPFTIGVPKRNDLFLKNFKI